MALGAHGVRLGLSPDAIARNRLLAVPTAITSNVNGRKTINYELKVRQRCRGEILNSRPLYR